ncbi:MAG: endonuclease/exonuclease/phosphatase family protein [Cyanobacteria bacterium J06648_10]
MLIGAKASCVKHQALHTKHSEPIANTPKVAIFSEFEIADRANSLMVVSVHAINFVPLAQFEAQMRAIATTLSQHQGGIVLAGDFNTWSQGRLRSLLQITEGLDLRPVTFPSKDRQHLKRFLLSPPLDHLFYRGLGHIPRSARVIDTPSSSDHNPLFVALGL